MFIDSTVDNYFYRKRSLLQSEMKAGENRMSASRHSSKITHGVVRETPDEHRETEM